MGFSPRYYADVDAMLLQSSGNPLKCHEEVLYSHLNVLTCSPLAGGCSEGLDAFIFFLKPTAHTIANASICTGSDVAISNHIPTYCSICSYRQLQCAIPSVIQQFHDGMRACVRPDDVVCSDWFEVEQGQRQGCAWYPSCCSTSSSQPC